MLSRFTSQFSARLGTRRLGQVVRASGTRRVPRRAIPSTSTGPARCVILTMSSWRSSCRPSSLRPLLAAMSIDPDGAMRAIDRCRWREERRREQQSARCREAHRTGAPTTEIRRRAAADTAASALALGAQAARRDGDDGTATADHRLRDATSFAPEAAQTEFGGSPAAVRPGRFEAPAERSKGNTRCRRWRCSTRRKTSGRSTSAS